MWSSFFPSHPPVYLLLPLCSLCLCASAQSFTRITSGPLVSTPGDSRSVSWVDVNNDGLPDCQITNGPAGGQPNTLYVNTGSGNFTALTIDPIVTDNAPSDGASWVDLDNDGDLDCFVANWYNANNLLFTNQNGSFAQVFTNVVVADAGYSETGAWGDYDQDGLVDLYVTNSGGQKRNFLYHNDGNGTFTKILTGAPVTDAFESRSCNWTDIDGDGDLDLFVTNESNQHENLYRNDGSGTFTKLLGSPLLTDGGRTMSSSWADYDNDGDLDVFLANDQGNNSLFRNDGNFSFTKITADTVAGSGGNSFSSAWADIDNDGDLDLFVTNSFGSGGLLPNFLYLNNGNGSFSRVSNSAPATTLDWSYGCAFADYDNDGFQDLAVATCRFSNTDRPSLLFHNDGNSNHWVSIRLVGTVTNRAAIGSKVRVKAVINGNPVWQLRELSAQSAYCSQNDLRAHFGLGSATQIDSIKVEWLSGAVESFAAVAADQFLTITEGQGIAGSPETAAAPAFRLFPNPLQDSFTLQTERPLQPGDRIIVRNLVGRVVLEQVLEQTAREVKLRLGNAAPGTYLVTVISGQNLRTSRLLKR